MIDEATRELCALYALGLLEGEALERFRARLAAGDAGLLAEFDAARRVVPMIGLAAPAARPAPNLKRRLFSRIGADGFYFLLAGEDGWIETDEHGVHVRPLFIDPADHSDTRLVRLDPGARCGALDVLAGESVLIVSGEVEIANVRLARHDWHRLSASTQSARSANGSVLFTLRAAPPPAKSEEHSRTMRATEGEWLDVGGGTHFKPLGRDHARGCDLTLARLEPGARFPEHHHPGAEELYILTGEARTLGRELGPGDYHRAAAGSDHDDTTSVRGCEAVVVVAAT